jgi:3',5'-cyclic AMP phosphodiesterase CpdA
MRRAPLLLTGLIALLTVSCTIDGAGYFCSQSSPDGRFEESRSMPQPAPQAITGDFSFIFISDTHIERGTHEKLAKLRDHLGGVAFVIVGGDVTQNGRQEDVDEFIRVRDTFGVPVYVTPGNHDLYDGGWARTKAFGPSSFTVTLGPDARLVCLDTANGTLGIRQMEWAEEVLRSAKESTVIVATHMQFFTNDFLETQEYTDPEETAMLLAAYERAGVDIVLAGHSHRVSGADIGTMHYRVNGSFLDGADTAHCIKVTCAGGSIGFERLSY